MKRFRSINRAIKRGHLRFGFDKVPAGFTAEGGLQFQYIPKLERRSNNNNKLWLAY